LNRLRRAAEGLDSQLSLLNQAGPWQPQTLCDPQQQGKARLPFPSFQFAEVRTIDIRKECELILCHTLFLSQRPNYFAKGLGRDRFERRCPL
jgi:hypothetical protein